MAERFFIIDGLSQIFRCYYAPFQNLTAPNGEPTRATYVFTNMLLQLAREQRPDYLAMAMDSREEQVFRREVSADYKAHRDAPPEDLSPQIDRILEIVDALGIPILHVPGYEADDILATLCNKLKDQGVDLFLVSRDKDLDQVLSDCVRLFDPMKNEIIGPDELRAKKGYGPEHAIEVQTLCGDTTDNIPGVKGVGPKKAAALIAKYGSAAAVIEHADELTPAMRENVKAFADKIEQTRKLVTLRQDVPMEIDLERCRFRGINWQSLAKYAEMLGFTRLTQQIAARIRESGGSTPGPTGKMTVPPETGAKHQPSPHSSPKGRGERFVDVGEEEFLQSFKFTGPKGETFDELMQKHAKGAGPSPPPQHFSEDLFAAAEPPDTRTERPRHRETEAGETPDPQEGRSRKRAGQADKAEPDAVHNDQAGYTASTGPFGQYFYTKPQQPCERKPATYTCVDTPEKFAAFLTELKAQKAFAFDTETDSLNPAWARLAGLSFSWEAGRGYYLPICGVGNCLPEAATLEGLKPIFANPDVKKVGQNIKYDLVVLASHGVPVAGVEFDNLIASFVIDSSRRSHAMEFLARELLGIEKITITDLIGTGRNQITFDSVETARATEYSGQDADVTFQLWGVLREQLAASGSEELFRDTEMPLVEVLAAMESEGVRLDCDVLGELGRELETRIDRLRGEIHRGVGHEFNIDSPKQLANVLFDELQLPVARLTKTGRSTDADTLDTLFQQTKNPVLGQIREYRELIKLKGTYIDPLPQMICRRTGRIHTNYSQTSAVTGRLSSSDPNLQNIPIRTDIGRQIRRAFVPRDRDHVLVTADYSQIELRVLAHFCGDERLRQAFDEDRDIHTFVAGQVFGVPLEQVTREQRSRAKAVNFGIVYGQSAFGLARTTGMSNTEAQGFIDTYFKRYPGIRHFIDRTIADARRNGFVRTILGRRRAVLDINSRNRALRSAAERFAVNTVMQGSAADLIKRAMINIHRRIIGENRPARMIIQVHDELVFDVPRKAASAESEMIRHEMCAALPLAVPLKVDIASGENWLESK